MNIVNYIEIQESDGTPKGAPITGDIELVGGGQLSIAPDDEGALEISAGLVTGDDPYYAQKYKDIVDGGDLLPDYSFTGMPYWISKINQVPGVENFIYMLAGGCSQLGLFAGDEHPGDAHEMPIFDMCTADVDCEDYNILYEYMEVVRLALDTHKTYVEADPSVSASDGYGIFNQYKALVSYWNYLVMLITGGSQVYINDDGDYIIRFVYQHAGNNLPLDVALPPQLAYTVTESSVDVPVSGTSTVFRPTSHTTGVVAGAGTETLITALAPPLNDSLLSNTQWITDINLGDMASYLPGTVIDYTGQWLNTENISSTSGSFTVE